MPTAKKPAAAIRVDSAKGKTALVAAMKKKPVMMLYYANFCVHCNMMKPNWEEAKVVLAAENNLQVAEVEYSNLDLLPQNLKGVVGFPTIVLLQNGKVEQEYSGDRSAATIVEFGRKCAQSAPTKPVKAKPKTSKKA